MNALSPIRPRPRPCHPRVAAFVPAKGNSERIPAKNVQILDGDHLFRRKLRQLIACPLIDTVYLDTESDEIAALAADLYVQVLCTAPFVNAETVSRAIQRMIDDPEADSLVGVSSARQYCWNGSEPVYGRGRIPNSVELDPTVIEAMSLYIVRRRAGEPAPVQRFGKRPILFELDPTEQVDINNPADLAMAETLCAGQRAQEVTRLRALQPYLSSPVLADIAKDKGLKAVLPAAIGATSPGKMLGRARTLQIVAIRPEERGGERWRGIYDALDSYRFVRPGCVIMVANEAPGFAYFGDLNATLAIRAGADCQTG
jgi:CMP-N-acetylneuraminic acid synthetase